MIGVLAAVQALAEQPVAAALVVLDAVIVAGAGRAVHETRFGLPPFRAQPLGALGSARPQRTRDYYRVEDENGRRYWLYREGLYGREDADRAPSWWIAGVFA